MRDHDKKSACACRTSLHPPSDTADDPDPLEVIRCHRGLTDLFGRVRGASGGSGSVSLWWASCCQPLANEFAHVQPAGRPLLPHSRCILPVPCQGEGTGCEGKWAALRQLRCPLGFTMTPSGISVRGSRESSKSMNQVRKLSPSSVRTEQTGRLITQLLQRNQLDVRTRRCGEGGREALTYS